LRESFVVAPLTLFEMKFEVGFDPVEFGEPALGKAPKSFDSIDVDFALTQRSAFLDAQVFIIANINQAVPLKSLNSLP
jgi:hypothetical protein